ncbi:DUF3299 domain-containing protein [Neptuniibacter halophilus]|uniref:DUF3299 domain-containing protein n=1 Tax=Neptuniibacter halophilus TaxID=651666 RepID=UPI002573A256|nr:DUF3299 domain-containing protein [Neptuniibacter halophilus]
MIRLPLFSVLFFSLFSFQVFAANLLNGETVREMEWEQLMPADFSLEDLFGQQDQLASIDDFDPKAQLLLDEMMAAMESAPVVPELDGAMVKLPGYVVPMESDGMNVTAFFLVPYFGACIHVPPPPSNQIVYVRFEPGTKVENLYDAIWVTGKLKTERVSNDMATSGYTMEAFQIEPYEL